MTHRYELLLCELCGRERVRRAVGAIIGRCSCGSESFSVYDLVAYLRDPHAIACLPRRRRLVTLEAPAEVNRFERGTWSPENLRPVASGVHVERRPR